jgi:hypothetical protein
MSLANYIAAVTLMIITGKRLAIAARFSRPALRIIRVLNQWLEWYSKPSVIRSSNGPEFISEAFVSWGKKRDIRIEYI